MPFLKTVKRPLGILVAPTRSFVEQRLASTRSCYELDGVVLRRTARR